jgi:hypothetical protein
VASRVGKHIRGNVVAYVALFFALGLVLVAPGTAAAGGVRYAAPNGNGVDPCSQADPCDVQTAVEAASDGDEVVLLRGGDPYMVGADQILVSADIDMHGQRGGRRPRIVSSGSPFGIRIDNASATVSDLTINYSGSLSGLAVFAGTAERVVSRSSVDGSNSCATVGGVIRDSVCWSTAEVAGSAVNISASGGGSVSTTLRNVTAVAAGTLQGRGIAIFTSSGSDAALEGKNVIARGTQTDVHAQTDSAMSTSAVVSLDYSNFASVTATGTGASVPAPGSASNQTAQPLFADAASGDFHQLPGSNTINAGTTDPLLGSLDLDREPRPFGSAPDIGADEFAVPPAAKITDGPRKRTRRRQATFEFTADEPVSDFQCKLDRRDYEACSSPKAYQGLRRGRRVFRVRALDGPATGPADVYRWRIRG